MSGSVDLAALGVPASSWSDLSPEHAQRVAAALDEPRVFTAGDPLPFLWHWAYFGQPVPTSALGADGHPRLPDDGSTAGLPRRMFAGGRLLRHGELLLGVAAERRARVLSCEPKAGRSGRLLVVTVGYEMEQDGRVVLEEEQDLVYREAGAPLPLPEGDEPVQAPPGGWRETVTLDPPALFRFSAVTFNAHRIHYDAGYATQVEGYPRLVVHGPLIALLLARSGQARLGGAVGSFSFRASAPLFEGLAFSVVGEPADDGVRVRAVRNDGAVAMEASVGLR